MSLTKEQKERLIAWFNQEQKHVCANCFHYCRMFNLYDSSIYGVCACRDKVDMIREANRCPDWTKKE